MTSETQHQDEQFQAWAKANDYSLVRDPSSGNYQGDTFHAWWAFRHFSQHNGPHRFPWENFPAYLIDKCEGQTISEEALQQAVADMRKDTTYCPTQSESIDLASIQKVMQDAIARFEVLDQNNRLKSLDASAMQALRAAVALIERQTSQVIRPPHSQGQSMEHDEPITFDYAQEAFRENPNPDTAKQYAFVAQEYYDDNMIGYDTCYNAMQEIKRKFPNTPFP